MLFFAEKREGPAKKYPNFEITKLKEIERKSSTFLYGLESGSWKERMQNVLQIKLTWKGGTFFTEMLNTRGKGLKLENIAEKRIC